MFHATKKTQKKARSTVQFSKEGSATVNTNESWEIWKPRLSGELEDNVLVPRQKNIKVCERRKGPKRKTKKKERGGRNLQTAFPGNSGRLHEKGLEAGRDLQSRKG